MHLMQCDEFCDDVTAASQCKLRERHMSSKAHVEKVACCITKRYHIVSRRARARARDSRQWRERVRRALVTFALSKRSVAACFLPSHCVPCSGCSIDITFVVTLHSSLPSSVIQKKFRVSQCVDFVQRSERRILLEPSSLHVSWCQRRTLLETKLQRPWTFRHATSQGVLFSGCFQRLQHPHTFQSVFLMSNIKSLGMPFREVPTDIMTDSPCPKLFGSYSCLDETAPSGVCPADSPSGASVWFGGGLESVGRGHFERDGGRLGHGGRLRMCHACRWCFGLGPGRVSRGSGGTCGGDVTQSSEALGDRQIRAHFRSVGAGPVHLGSDEVQHGGSRHSCPPSCRPRTWRCPREPTSRCNL